jgi:hypothetical protein
LLKSVRLWHHTLVYCPCLASMQWYGGTSDKDHQTWTHGYGCYQHIGLGFTPTKNTFWISMWHPSQHECRNPSFGLITKARDYKVVGQEESMRVMPHAPESIGKCEGMNPTLPRELPLWELESRWTLESSERNCRGQNSMD